MKRDIIIEEETSDDKIIRDNVVYEISKKKRWNLFLFLIFVISIISNFDNGIVPAATEKIKKDLDINDSYFGFLGSCDYFGRIISSIIYLNVINKINRKYLLSESLIFKAITLILCFLSDNYYFIATMRCLNGISQVFYTIYLPIWCDQFGGKSRTIMLALQQIGLPLGIVFGYSLCKIIKKNWIIAFIIEGIILIILGIITLFISDLFFNKDIEEIKEENNKEEKILKYQIISDKTLQKSTLYINMKKIITNLLFMSSLYSYSIAQFSMGIIKFWGDDYMTNVLHEESDKIKMIIYSVISLTGPTLGILFGGISGQYFGGYTNKKAIYLWICYDIFSCCLGIPSIAVKSIYLYGILTWFYLFFCASVCPLSYGIMMNSVENKLKGDAVTILNFLTNLIGNLPPSYVYGLINDKYKDYNPRIAMYCIFCFRFTSLITLGFATYKRLKNDKQENTNMIEKKLLSEQ
jgi:sugar phosphate permease